jgi:hypothetical protein
MKRAIKACLSFGFALFIVLGVARSGTAYTATPNDVIFWWDTDGDLSTTETEVTLDPEGTLNASLYVSGIGEDFAWGSCEADVNWDNGLFSSPSIDVNDALWPTGQTEETGPPFEGKGGTAAGADPIWGNDKKPMDISLTLKPGFTTYTLETDGDGGMGRYAPGYAWEDNSSGVMHWGVAPNAGFTIQDLEVNAVPIPGALLLLGSGLLGMFGIRRRTRIIS